MGNSLPLPCVRHPEADEAEGAAAAAGAKRWRRKQKRQAFRRNVRAARPGHVVPVVDMPAEEEEEGERFRDDAWRPGCRVERPAAGFGEDGGMRRVKIVVRRKDIAELVAMLEQGDAATMVEELNVGISVHSNNANVNDGGGRVTMSPCRDSWRPRLSIIPEN